MKAKLAFVLSLIMILSCVLLSGCQEAAPSMSAKELIVSICSENGLSGGYTFSSEGTKIGEYLDEDMIASYYGDGLEAPDFSQVTEYCVYIDEHDALVMSEVGVFLLSKDANRELFMAYLQARIDARLQKAKSYPDIDTDTLNQAIVKSEGAWVYYVVLKDCTDSVAEKISNTLG